jgi:hypothetical protein
MRNTSGGNSGGATLRQVLFASIGVNIRITVLNGILALLVGAAASFGLASPSSAATVIATITGTVGSGTDVTGVFGAANSNLAGAAFAVVYTIDDSAGVRSDNPPTFSSISGRDSANPVSATLTINGRSVSLGNGTTPMPIELSSQVVREYTQFSSRFFSFDISETVLPNLSTNVGEKVIFIDVEIQNPNIAFSYDWESGFYYPLQPGDAVSGNSIFTIIYFDAAGNLVRATGDLNVTSLMVSGPIETPAVAKNLGALPCPNCAVGNPLNAATGNKFQAERDFLGGPATGLAFARYYNSEDTTGLPFGVS